MLIDTDVIIWYMRGNLNALQTLTKYHGFMISVVSYMELVQGMRNKYELASLRRTLKSWDTRIIYLTAHIPHPISKHNRYFIDANSTMFETMWLVR